MNKFHEGEIFKDDEVAYMCRIKSEIFQQKKDDILKYLNSFADVEESEFQDHTYYKFTNIKPVDFFSYGTYLIKKYAMDEILKKGFVTPNNVYRRMVQDNIDNYYNSKSTAITVIAKNIGNMFGRDVGGKGKIGYTGKTVVIKRNKKDGYDYRDPELGNKVTFERFIYD